MSDSFDDRRKALEDEYFRKKEQETLEKLRAQMQAGESATAAVVKCPKCEGALIEIEHEGVNIDRCQACGGVWLDAGELEKLTQREDRGSSWLTRFLSGRNEAT